MAKPGSKSGQRDPASGQEGGAAAPHCKGAGTEGWEAVFVIILAARPQGFPHTCSVTYPLASAVQAEKRDKVCYSPLHGPV